MDDLEGPFEKPAVVIDIGSHTLKAGFAFDNHPLTKFRNLAARPKGLKGPFGYGHYGDDYEVLIGDQAVIEGETLDLCAPVVKGEIVHWDNFERTLHHVLYKELRVAPEDRAIMIVCSPQTPISEKLRVSELIYDVLNSPAICIQPSPTLCLYASGVTTGIAVDCGYDSVDINPVYAGTVVKYAHVRSGYGGREMNKFFEDSLAERDIDFGYHTRYVIDERVIPNAYVTMNSAMSMRNNTRFFESPLGGKIDITDECFMAGECIFQPDLVMSTRKHQHIYSPLHEAIMDAILRIDHDLRKEMYKGIVMAGGLSKIPGIAERIDLELTTALKRPIKTITSDESEVLAWMGGSIFASIPEVKRMWVTKEQFAEHGQKIIYNRFM